jgi:AcrR family transcriptional regulator
MAREKDSARRKNRRQAFLIAAEALFLEQGFDRVSINAIVQRSGGSLATFYDMFGNKLGLLRAVLDRASDEELESLKSIYSEEAQPGEILRKLAWRYHAFVTAPRSLALMRLVIGQSLDDPEFGRQFSHDMHLRHMTHLAEIFSQWTVGGKARIDRPQEAAELYFAMVLCDAPLRAMLGIMPEPTDAGTLERRLAPFIDYYRIVS